jgi:hypothetical protein
MKYGIRNNEELFVSCVCYLHAMFTNHDIYYFIFFISYFAFRYRGDL